MIFPCPNRIYCPGQTNLEYDWPLANLSSEPPDQILYIGESYGGNKPWTDTPNNPRVYQTCEQTTQEYADLCAGNKGVTDGCTEGCTTGGGGANDPGNPTTSGPKYPGNNNRTRNYPNNRQTCPGTCPDGTATEGVVEAGEIIDVSQEAADRRARELACQRARNGRCPPTILLVPENLEVCMGSSVSGFAIVLGTDAKFDTIISGYPAGMVVTQVNDVRVNVSGIPTAVGEFNCLLNAVNKNDPSLNTLKNMPMKVFKINTTGGRLPDAIKDTAYTTQLSVSGAYTDPIRWTIDTLAYGGLPSGLNLNVDTGVISGTPTSYGHYTFLLNATSARAVCSSLVSIDVCKGGEYYGPSALNCGPGQNFWYWWQSRVDGSWQQEFQFHQLYLATGQSWDWKRQYELMVGRDPFEMKNGALTLTEVPPGLPTSQVYWIGWDYMQDHLAYCPQTSTPSVP